MNKRKIILLFIVLFIGIDTSTAHFFQKGWKRFTGFTGKKQAQSKARYSFNRTKSFFNRIKASILKSASAARLANFIKKYKKPIKKIALTGTGLAVGIKLKQTLAEYLKPEELRAIDQSLSYKLFGQSTIEDIKKGFEKLIGKQIEDYDFAMKEVIEALKREQSAQARKDFVAYHGMPASVYVMLQVYTILYNEKFNQEQKNKDFVFLRTHKTLAESENFSSGLSFWEDKFLNEDNYKMDEEQFARDYLLSMAPFLFSQGTGESALFSPAMKKETQEKVIAKILGDIFKLYDIDPERKVGFFRSKTLVESVTDTIMYHCKSTTSQGVVLQIIFDNQNVDTFENISGQLKNKEKLKNFGVGYGDQHIFSNLYWANPYGVSCDHKILKFQPYNGQKLFEKLVQNKWKNPFETMVLEHQAQVRGVLTLELFKKRGYNTYVVDLEKSGELLNSVSQRLELDIRLVLKSYGQ